MLYAAASAMYLAMKTAVLVDEICAVLDIWCFDIVTPRRKRRPRTTPSAAQRVKIE